MVETVCGTKPKSVAISQQAERMAAPSSTTRRGSLPVRSAGRNIVATDAVTGIVIAIVRRFLPGRIKETPCLLYRHLWRQLSSPHREKLRPPHYQCKASSHPPAHLPGRSA